MKNTNYTEDTIHCMRSTLVYDWLCVTSDVFITESVFKRNKKITVTETLMDTFCFKHSDNQPILIWRYDGEGIINGTLSLKNNSFCNSITILINNEIKHKVLAKQTISLTLNNLISLHLLSELQHSIEGIYTLMLKRKVKITERSRFNISEIKKLDFEITDEFGNPFFSSYSGKTSILNNSLHISNIKKTKGILCSNEENRVMKKCEISTKGYIIVHFTDYKYSLEPIPFCIKKSVLLYAPDSTKVECLIGNIYPSVELLPPQNSGEYFKMKIHIEMLQNVEVVKEVNILTKGQLLKT
ncbi:S-Ena type endospore appendage [Priestia aryabhattai]|uniref:S-Ena type endospore appendage n=1 Tax=Priestia aryabhattai TaxID=412384 RepID=UPI003D2DACE3